MTAECVQVIVVQMMSLAVDLLQYKRHSLGARRHTLTLLFQFCLIGQFFSELFHIIPSPPKVNPGKIVDAGLQAPDNTS